MFHLWLRHHKITDIETSLGRRILEDLQDDGWRVTSAYDLFDKGIDYDAYRLRKGWQVISLEWTNWDEWTLKGTRSMLNEIRRRYPDLS